MTSCLVSISTSLFITTNLGNLATDVTTYLLIGLTVLMNAKELVNVLLTSRAGIPKMKIGHLEQLHNEQWTGKTQEACEAFASLMLGQVMEVVLPIRSDILLNLMRQKIMNLMRCCSHWNEAKNTDLLPPQLFSLLCGCLQRTKCWGSRECWK